MGIFPCFSTMPMKNDMKPHRLVLRCRNTFWGSFALFWVRRTRYCSNFSDVGFLRYGKICFFRS